MAAGSAAASGFSTTFTSAVVEDLLEETWLRLVTRAGTLIDDARLAPFAAVARAELEASTGSGAFSCREARS